MVKCGEHEIQQGGGENMVVPVVWSVLRHPLILLSWTPLPARPLAILDHIVIGI